MTCIEKLREIHPDWTERDISDSVLDCCPATYDIMDIPGFCRFGSVVECGMCWNREVSEECETEEEPEVLHRELTVTVSDETVERLGDLWDAAVEEVSQ